MSGRIVVGVDGSKSSVDALLWAANQARLTGASLEVVTTWESPPNLGWPAPSPDKFHPESDARQMLSGIITRELGGTVEIDVSQLVIEGRPAPALLEQAQGADLLVVGSRGRGTLVGTLLGSVSEHCVTHGSCPVLVVHHRTDSDS